MERRINKYTQKTSLPELDLSEELDEDSGWSLTMEKEVRDRCKAQVDAMVAQKYTVGWDSTPKNALNYTGKTGKLWEGLRHEVGEKLKKLRHLQVIEEEQNRMLTEQTACHSTSEDLLVLLDSYTTQLYSFLRAMITSEGDSYAYLLTRTSDMLHHLKDKITKVKESVDVISRKMTEGLTVVRALETESQSQRHMMTTYAGQIATLSETMRKKIEGKQFECDQAKQDTSTAAEALIQHNIHHEKHRFQLTQRQQRRRQRQAQHLIVQEQLLSEEHHVDTLTRQADQFIAIFGTLEPEVVTQIYWEKVDTGLALTRELERAERRKMELKANFERLKQELEAEKIILENITKDAKETRLKDTNQTLIHIVFSLLTSLVKLTSHDRSSELGPYLAFTASINSTQLAQLAETTEMMEELPRLMLIIEKKFTTAREIAFQRRFSKPKKEINEGIRGRKSRKAHVTGSSVSRLKQEFESLLLPTDSAQSVKSQLRLRLPDDNFRLFSRREQLTPSQSLQRLKTHSSSPKRSGSLTDRAVPSQTQGFPKTVISINKDLSRLSSKQVQNPKGGTSFSNMLGNLQRRQMKLSGFRLRESMEASTGETSGGRPGWTPLSKSSSLSPYQPKFPRVPPQLPLFP